MPKPKPLPPVEFLQECFRYDLGTGALYWRHRPDHHFAMRSRGLAWNTKYAGSRADTTVAHSEFSGRQDQKVKFTCGGEAFAVQASRVIFKMLHNVEPAQVDHRNGDSTDNRPWNLRAADHVKNQRNVTGYKDRGLPKGVYHKARGRFSASICVQGRTHHLGSYGSPAEAHAAWCAWAKPLHREFFNPGPPSASVFD